METGMTDTMNAISSSSGSPKLPIISESQNLVATVPGSLSATRRPAANDWATDLRDRLDQALLREEEPEEKDVELLKQELISLFINALQKDNRSTWILIRDALTLAVQYKEFIIIKPELTHYLKRLHHHLTTHQERLFDLQILELLKQVFPQIMQFSEPKNERGQKQVFSNPTPPPVSQAVPSRSSRRIVQRPSLTFPNKKNPYRLNIMEETDIHPKPLTFGDLRSSIADVALEIAAREAIWSACLGSTAMAVNVDLPVDEEEVHASSPSTSETEPGSSPSKHDNALQLQEKEEHEEEHPAKPMTGREAVEHFTKCYHTGKIKSMHFNIVASRYFEPYNLIAVSEQKVKKEHYVFSTFGVLHVHANQPSENLSLSDWHRESVLFKALTTIPFFKNYLIRKMLQRWRGNMKFSHFAKERFKIKSMSLQAIPGYGAALLHISALLQQLQALKFLTFENDKSYELGEFESDNIYQNVAAEEILERFFRYTKMVVTVTGEELQRKVHHCQEQVRQKPVFSKESLHLQRLKREHREENLRKAKQELARMLDFIALVNHMLLCQVFQIIRLNFSNFVNQILNSGPNSMREGLFKAKLIFDKQGNLTVHPPLEKFSQLLAKVLDDVPQLYVRAAEKLGGQDDGELNTQEEEQVVLVDSHHVEESPRQSSLRASSRQVSEISKLQSQSTTMAISSKSASKIQDDSQQDVEPQPEANEVSVEKTNAADEIFQAPEMSPTKIPRKRDDDLGQATPRMILSVHGHLEQKRTDPLQISFSLITTENLHDMAGNDEKFMESMKQQNALMSNSLEEISEYIEKNSWLNDFQAFCAQWNTNSVKELRGKAAYTIEQKLNELRQWTDKVKSFDKTYMTENGLFYIDCLDVHDSLVPRLTQIFQEICDFVADEAFGISKKFQKDIDAALDILKKKDAAVGGFVEFARHVAVYKRNSPQYQQSVEYVKSLYEVIRMSYRQLSDEEEKVEETLWQSWEAFLFQMQEASDYVNTQGPMIAQDLADNYSTKNGRASASAFSNSETDSVSTGFDPADNTAEFRMLEERAAELYSEATDMKFTEAGQDPSVMLREITKIREEFHEVYRQMGQCNKWREAITGEPFDMSVSNEMMNQLDLQQELWQYIEVSTHQIRDWKNQLVKKFNVKKALDKVMEWQVAAGQLRDHLPQNSAVLTHWYNTLQDFKHDLPIMYRLSSPVLKERHLKRIFVEMGEQYDCKHEFTVGELLSYNLHAHSHNIQRIFRTAQSEDMIEGELAKLSKTWEETNFKLAKHIPESVYKTDQTTEPPKSGGLQRYRRERSNTDSEPKLRANLNDLYVVIEVPEMLYLIEDGQVVLQRILSSQYLSGHKEEAEKWASALQEAEQILQLWQTAQMNWLYLLKVFDEKEFYKKYESLSKKFEDVHEKYHDVMLTILGDPKVTSILTKPRGSKGFRQLQGARLKDFLVELVIVEETILSELSEAIDKVRSQFPRLYFLSESETVALLSVSRNPTALVPHVKKCFSGISNMTFSLPKDVQGTGTSLDYSMFAHRLQVSSVQGNLGEVVSLSVPLPFSLDTCKWLSQLEKYLKSTILKTLQACVEARLDGSQEVVKILEELLQCEAKLESKEEEALAHEIKSKYAHWLLHFPSQCILISEAVLFGRDVQKALSSGDQKSINIIRDEQSAKIEQYTSVLKANAESDLGFEARGRLHTLLGNLVSQTSYHRDVMDELLQDEAIDPKSFNWLKTLRYHMDIERVLQATTRSSERPMSGLDENMTEPTRNKTTVSHTYNLGKCAMSQLMARFKYDYEYIGPTSRLMVTPLTERACITLTQALSGFQCGSLIGPSGTGKTSIVTDLAQAMGRHLVLYNCSGDYTIKCMTKALVGMVQSGCWVLWNNFDKLPYGLSSVIGQQLQYLTNSIRALASSKENLYHARDLQLNVGKRPDGRRNTTATLHSMSSPQHQHAKDASTLESRRFSVEKDINIRETDYYQKDGTLPLISEDNDQDTPVNEKGKLGWTSSLLGNVLYNGNLVPVNANYGCFMNITMNGDKGMEIPHSTKMQMRQCVLSAPDIKILLEIKLLCEGFNNHEKWAKKLAIFFKNLTLQLPQLPAHKLGLRMIMTVISVATKMLHQHRVREKKSAHSTPTSTAEKKGYNVMSPEEASLVKAISVCLVARMTNSQETNILKNAVRDIFPQSARPKSASLGYPKELVTAVEEQLKQEHLQITQDLVDKILLLYSALKSGKGVILTGPTASGKSTCYKILAKALTSLSSGVQDDFDDQELTPDRSLNSIYSQKLKILKDKNMRETAKDVTKKWQKFSAMSNLLSKAAGTFASVIVEDSDQGKVYPKIVLHTVFPNVYNHQQLYGDYHNGIWKEGILEGLLRTNKTKSVMLSAGQGKSAEKKNRKTDSTSQSPLNKWIVFDGTICDDWMSSLITTIDSSGCLSLANGGHLKVEDHTRLIFETTDLRQASPSAMTHCSLVSCIADTVTWKCLWEGWGESARQKWALNTAGWQVLTSLANTVFSKTLDFLKNESSVALLYGQDTSSLAINQTATGVVEVTSFLNILSAFMDKHFLREDLEKMYAVEMKNKRSPFPKSPNSSSGSKLQSVRFTPKSSSGVEDFVPNYMQAIKCLFAFSYIWSFGGNLHDSCKTKFDDFARETLRQAAQPVQLPAGNSVYDLTVDVRQGAWQTWSDRPLERPRPLMGHYNNTPQIERFNFLVDLMVSTHHPVLLTGAPGVGKTSLIENLTQSRHAYTKIVMSPGYDTHTLQTLITKKLEFQNEQNMKNAALPGHRSDDYSLFFIDDLSEASTKNASGIQPNLELLRQMLSTGTIFDHDKNIQHSIDGINFITATTVPGKNVITSGLACLFTTFNMFSPSEDELSTIYNKIIQNWLEEFPTNALDHHYELTRAIVRGSAELYQMMKQHFPPTPQNAHYAFSLHNLSHLFESMLLLSPRIKIKPNRHKNPKVDGIADPPMMRTVIRLWLHESCRAFADRLTSPEDTTQFENIAKEVLRKHFSSDREPSPELSATTEDSPEQQQPMSKENTFDMITTDESRAGTANETINEKQSKNSPGEPTNGDGVVKTSSESTVVPGTSAAERDNSDSGQSSAQSGEKIVTPGVPKHSSSNETREIGAHSTSRDSKLQTRLENSQLTTDRDEDEEGSGSDEESSSSSEESTSSDSSDGDVLIIPDFLKQKGIAQDKPPTPPDTGRTTARQSVRGLKKGVSFKVGLISEREKEQYYGPLLKYEHVLDPEEKLMDIIFSRYIIASSINPSGNRFEKGYKEGNITTLTVALEMALEKFNQDKDRKLELVFFKEAVHHIARLTRVLARDGSHAILVGLEHFTGCATVVRMATSLANLKLFEVMAGSCPDESRRLLRNQLQACSKSAAFVNRKVVLLVKDALGDDAMDDIYSFMKQGTCAHLYSEEDLFGIATRMTSSQVKITRQDKVDSSFAKFLKRVQQNVHVVVCLKGQGNDPCRTAANYPAFLKKPCSFNIYHPWNNEAYIAIAEKWLIKKEQMPVMWNDQDTVNQIKSAAKAMAYIHCVSKRAVEKQYSHYLRQNRLLSPLKFKEFVWVFKVIAADIARKEQGKLESFEAGLNKVNEALGTISKYQKEVSQLNPSYKEALAVIENHVKSIHAQQQEYIKALDVCKQQEKLIEELTIPAEKLRGEAHDAFNKISPVFMAALDALNCLSQSDLYEIKSFSKPPYHVCKVMETVCLLFNLQPSWANAKSLMTRTSLYSDLEFYDKGKISDELFLQLADFYFNEEMDPEKLKKVNMAAASFAKWLRAVYIYADLTRSLAPKKKELKQAEKKLAAAQLELGQHRKLANKVKSDLEARIKTHKEVVQHSKAIEKSIDTIQKKIKRATNLMESMDAQSTVWKIRAQVCRQKIQTIPGDALLAAAAVIYFGCLESSSRTNLLKDWKKRCRLNDFSTSSVNNERNQQDADGNGGPSNYINDGESGLPSENTACSDDLMSLQSTGEISSNGSVHSYHQSLSSEDLTQERIIDQTIAQTKLGTKPAMNDDLLALRDDFSIEVVLSSEDELNDWKMQGYPMDAFSIYNALITRVTNHVNPHCWPLLIDPDYNAERWVRALQTADNFIHPEDLSRSEEADMLELMMESDLPVERNIDGTITRTSGTSADTMSGQSSRPVTRGDSPHTAQKMTETSITSDLQSNVDLDTSINILDLSDPPPDKLWVVRADDETIVQKILTALVQGLSILVTHLECKKMPSTLTPIILKQRFFDHDGVHKVTIGNHQFNWHRDFRLYISASLPVSLWDLSVQAEMERASMIDMTVSQEGIMNHLLHAIMAKERPEFETQKRSATKDIIYHQPEIHKEQELILQRVLNLSVPLLEDSEMSDKLIKCQHNIQHNSTALEDIHYHAIQQDEKKTPYLPVATSAANLYSMIKKIEPLNKLYCVNLGQFYDIVENTIQREYRGKGAQGAPKARAQELIQHITGDVFKFVSAMVNETHGLLFALLITLDRMASSRKLTSNELNVFVKGIDAPTSKTIHEGDKPHWLSNQAWEDCSKLETILPCMESICKSLQDYSSEWEEYFQCPIVLMNQLPDDGYQGFTAFQKCVLWRVVSPQKLFEICEALILHELGGTCKTEKCNQLHEVIAQSNGQTPVIFVESTNNQHDTAINTLLQYAKESGMEGKVHVVSCGLDIQVKELREKISESMQNGHWCVVQNAHLVSEWTSEIVELFKRIIECKNDDVHVDNASGHSEIDSLREQISENGEKTVHENFRLFIALDSSTEKHLPGLIVQNSLKISQEQTSNIKDTFWYSYQTVNQMISKATESCITKQDIVSVSLLHSILKHSIFYGRTIYETVPEWDISTLHNVTQAMVNSAKLNLGNDCLDGAICKIYCDLCFSDQDKMSVKDLISTLIPRSQDTEKSCKETEIRGILQQLIISLSKDNSEGLTTDQKLSCLSNFTGHNLGLPEVTENNLTGRKSRKLLDALQLVLDVPGKRTIKDLDLWQHSSILQDVEAMLNDLPDLPKTKADGFYPMEIFLYTEVEAWKQMLLTVKSDIHQLQGIAKGDTPCTSSHEKMMRDITSLSIPAPWLIWTSASIPLTHWVEQMKTRLLLLNKYTKEEKPAAYNLSAFLRPDRFIQCVIQTNARKQFKDVAQLTLDVQVMKEDTVAEPPAEGVYIEGLQLHNATWKQSRGIFASQHESPEIQPLPLVYIKPKEVKKKLSDNEQISEYSKHHVYDCPLYIDDERLQFHIPLQCQKDQLLHLAHHRTFISAYIP